MANVKISNKSIFATAAKTERARSVVLGGDPKGKYFLYTNGKNVIMREVANPVNCQIVTKHGCNAKVAKYSPSGFYIASGDEHGKVSIWDTTQEEHIVKNEYQPVGSINDIAWDFESKRIAVAGDGREKFCHVFFADSGTSVGELSGVSKSCNSIDFKPTRPFRICAASEDKAVAFYEGPPFKFSKTYQGHTNFVNCVRYAPDGSVFISGSSDKRACIFDGKTGDHIGELGSPAHNGGIYGLSFSPDSRQVLTVSGDKTAKIWDVETKSVVSTFNMGSDVRDQQLGCLWMGDNILTVSLSGHINYLDKNDSSLPLRVLRGHNKSITAMNSSSDKSTTFTGDFDAGIYSWNRSTGDCDEMQGKRHGSKIQDLIAADDTLISISMDDTIKFSDIVNRQYGDSVKLDSQPRSVDHQNGLTIIACINHVIVFEDRQKKFAQAVPYEPLSVSISSSGAVAVGGEKDKKVHIYSVASGGLTETQVIDNQDVALDLEYSPDGAYLATAGADRYVRCYTVSDGKMMFGSCPHTARATTIKWSPNSRYFATASLDNSIIIWEPSDSLNNYTKLKAAHPLATVTRILWLDDNTLQSCADDSCIKTWNIE